MARRRGLPTHVRATRYGIEVYTRAGGRYRSTHFPFTKELQTPAQVLAAHREDHAHAVALYFLHYNFARIHKTLRVTPAMAAGLAEHVWSVEEIVGLLDRRDEAAA